MCFWADGDSPTVTDLLPLKLEFFPGFLFFYFAGNWFCLLPPASCIILSFFFFFRTSLQALGLFYCHWIRLFYLRPILHVEHLYRYSAKKQHRGHYTLYSIGYLAVNARPRILNVREKRRVLPYKLYQNWMWQIAFIAARYITSLASRPHRGWIMHL